MLGGMKWVNWGLYYISWNFLDGLIIVMLILICFVLVRKWALLLIGACFYFVFEVVCYDVFKVVLFSC